MRATTFRLGRMVVGDCREPDSRIIAQGRDGFQCHVAAAILLEQDHPDEADEGIFEAERPNQKWIADFTYIWTAEAGSTCRP